MAAALLTVSAFADTGPKAQLKVLVKNAPEEPYYLDLLEKGDYQGHIYGSGDGDDTYSGLDWGYSEEEIAALDDELLDALRDVYKRQAPEEGQRRSGDGSVHGPLPVPEGQRGQSAPKMCIRDRMCPPQTRWCTPDTETYSPPTRHWPAPALSSSAWTAANFF